MSLRSSSLPNDGRVTNRLVITGGFFLLTLMVLGTLPLTAQATGESAAPPAAATPTLQPVRQDRSSPWLLAAAPAPAPPHRTESDPGFICTPGRVSRQRESCLDRGPGITAYRIAHIELPDPLPELSLVELTPEPGEEVVPFTFAYVHTLPLSIYNHPMEAALGLPPTRILYSGDQWVSVDGEVDYEGTAWYQINEGEFVPAESLAIASPSRFQGVYLNEQPAIPFAWINRAVQPSRTPRGPANAEAPLYQRYQRVSIYAAEFMGSDELWYLVGEDQWVEQSNVSKVTVDPPPPEVGQDAWIEVDLFEQTLAAYEGSRMVYATLISSGRSGSTFTDSGLFRIWYKQRAGKMSNPDAEDGSAAWYYLEDVPWTMYFNGPTALHTAYWHDAFGFTRSHGCVNLAPRDAEWLFNWTTPHLPAGVDDLMATGTWVWVHNTSPFGE
jgi:hypothetical protein